MEKNIHEEVVTGIVKMILRLTSKKEDEPISFADIMAVGIDGSSEKASMFIVEFAKDGLSSMSEKAVNKIMAGDYSELWDSTNKYLVGFGYGPVTPTVIKI